MKIYKSQSEVEREAQKTEKEWGIGGLSTGIYLEFATAIAEKLLNRQLSEFRRMVEEEKWDKKYGWSDQALKHNNFIDHLLAKLNNEDGK